MFFKAVPLITRLHYCKVEKWFKMHPFKWIEICILINYRCLMHVIQLITNQCNTEVLSYGGMFSLRVLQRPVSECLVPWVGDQCPDWADHLRLLFWAWNNKLVTHKPDMCLFVYLWVCVWLTSADVAQRSECLTPKRLFRGRMKHHLCFHSAKCPHFLHWWEFSRQLLLDYLWNWSFKRTLCLLNAESVIKEFTLNIIKNHFVSERTQAKRL